MPESTTSKNNRPRRRQIWAIAIAVLVGGLALVLVWNWNWSAPQPFAGQIAQSQPGDTDTPRRRLILGSWEDEYQGKRTMTLNEDGTGTMVVELSGWRAALSASRLTFRMKWSVEGGRLKKQTIGGEPEAQVKMILSTMGDRVDEPILELTEDRLLLLDQDGKTKYDWKRARNKG